ncbi:MAG TPA: hypothetical protein PKM54_03355, partial [Anaerolineales bacterium]|nr:hypothetical protein [Anaerolineales bacterium]
MKRVNFDIIHNDSLPIQCHLADDGRAGDPIPRILQRDVVEVVEVLAVEASKYKQAGTHEGRAVPPTRNRCIQRSLDVSNLACLKVNREQIIEIVAEPSSEDVDL